MISRLRKVHQMRKWGRSDDPGVSDLVPSTSCTDGEHREAESAESGISLTFAEKMVAAAANSGSSARACEAYKQRTRQERRSLSNVAQDI